MSTSTPAPPPGTGPASLDPGRPAALADPGGAGRARRVLTLAGPRVAAILLGIASVTWAAVPLAMIFPLAMT